MEVNFSFLQILFSFLCMLILLKFGLWLKPKRKSYKCLPPGPWKLPFIGNLHLLVGSLPHHALRDLAMKYGPLMYLKLGEVPTIIVSSPGTAKELMKKHDITFASRPEILAAKIMSYGCQDIAFAPYGEYWRQLRKICVSELLSPKRVQSFKSLREEEFSNLMQWMASNSGSQINFTEKIYSSTYGLTSRAALGMKTKEHETFVLVVQESLKLASGFDIGDVYPSITLLHKISGMRSKLMRLHLQADRILDSIIDDHRNAPKIGESGEKNEDLVDVLLKFQEDGIEVPLTTENIKSVILDVFTAGSETSATTVDWAMAEMMKHPRILKRAQDEVQKVFKEKGYVDEASFGELKYLKSVIKETLRLHPPLPLLLPRVCSQECMISGYNIPVQTRIMVNAWAMGRDPKLWDHAEIFNPERFLESSVDFKGSNFEFIPFGAGRRICPGMAFGLANVELPLASFLYHFDWSLGEGMRAEELDMTEQLGVTVRRKEDLKPIPVVKIPLPIK